jgi:hypothetical protein
MWLRFIVTAGLVALGYYLGREVGRQESVRGEIAAGRAQGLTEEIDPGEGAGKSRRRTGKS